MKTIFVTISRGSLIRNFFYTGIIPGLLAKGMRVVVITPYHDHPAFNTFTHKNLILEPFQAAQKRLQVFFTELQKNSIFNKTVNIRYRYRVTGRAPSQFLYYVRLLFLAPLKFIPGIKTFVRWLDSFINPDYAHDYLFEKYKPNLVFTTAAVNDAALIKSAKRFGVKTVDMPKSWDNLSKMLIPIKADYLFVWNPFMRDQALKFQGYKDEEIVMTGIPQFDFYSQKERLLGREAFCRQFGMDPAKKIILYGSTGGNCVDELPYLELLSSYIEEGKLSNTQVLVRPHIGHPKDEERFRAAKKLPHIFLDESGIQDDAFKDHWEVSERNVNHLFNSLYHADVCLNIASTLTLDAISCGTPVININFDPKPVSPHWSTKRLYGSDYIDAIVQTGASWLATSEEDFLKALQDILVLGNKDDKKKQEKELLDYLVFDTNGNAGKRLRDTLLEILGQ